MNEEYKCRVDTDQFLMDHSSTCKGTVRTFKACLAYHKRAKETFNNYLSTCGKIVSKFQAHKLKMLAEKNAAIERKMRDAQLHKRTMSELEYKKL